MDLFRFFHALYKRESRLSPARPHQSKRVGMSFPIVDVFQEKLSPFCKKSAEKHFFLAFNRFLSDKGIVLSVMIFGSAGPGSLSNRVLWSLVICFKNTTPAYSGRAQGYS